jgi:DNA invertase Pin-like site-specific DNA recombinase
VAWELDVTAARLSQWRERALLAAEAALKERERDIISERIQAGLTAARARGRKGGRPKKLTPKKQR